MVELAQLQSFRKDLLLGMGKAAADGLQTLSLAATQSKFERQALPVGSAMPRLQLKERTFPNPQARRILLRLLAGRDGNANDSIAQAIPQVLVRHGLALHPFDFAALEDFVERYAGQLSAEARDWLQLVRPERNADQETYFDGQLTEADLMQASKAQRIAFLRELRLRAPSRARELVEAMLPTEPADMRQRLVSVLSRNVNAEDQVLLQALLKDRAPSVKDLAQKLLNRIPGSENLQRQLARVKEDLQIKSEGLLRRRKVFIYKGPETKTGQNPFATLLEGLRLQDIAAAVGMNESSLIDIAVQSEKLRPLLLCLIRKAVDEGKYDLCEKACAELTGYDGSLMAGLIDEEFAERPETDRHKIIELCFLPKQWPKLPDVWVLQRIAAFMPSALPENTAADLLNHAGWQALEGPQRKGCFDAIAHLIPAAHSAAFAKLVEADAPRAALYHRFLQSLTERGKHG